MGEYDMCRDVPGAYRPFSYAVRPKAVQGSGSDVVFGVGNQKLSGIRVDGNSIRCLDTLFSAVFDKVARNDLPSNRSLYNSIRYCTGTANPDIGSYVCWAGLRTRM